MQKKGKCKLRLLLCSSEGNSPDRSNLGSLAMNNTCYKSNSAFLSTSLFLSPTVGFVCWFVFLFARLGFCSGFCGEEVVYLFGFVVLVFFPGGKRGKLKQLTESLNVSLIETGSTFQPSTAYISNKPLWFHHSVRINNWSSFLQLMALECLTTW